jgi:hypothetical protein
MDKIIQANIDRYQLLLTTETDATKRAMIIRLLAEEQEKLKLATTEERKPQLNN